MFNFKKIYLTLRYLNISVRQNRIVIFPKCLDNVSSSVVMGPFVGRFGYRAVNQVFF